MATTYAQVLKEVAATLNAIDATGAAAIDTQYVAGVTNSNLVADLPVTFAQDTILGVESEIAAAICANAGHQERKDFLTTTTLTSGAAVPATVSSVPVIGPVGAVYQGTTPLVDLAPIFGEEVALSRVLSVVSNPNSMYAADTFYWYVISGNAIYHTRSTAVTVELCTFARGSFTAGNPIRVRDWHVPALVSGVVARLLREDQFPQMQQMHAQAYALHLQSIAAFPIDRQESAAAQPTAR